jgi:class 3 adenylate cyclase/tetratricopeptide (TPR) repeat protein
VICTSCGAENRSGARFCDSCGALLAAAPAREQRKVVTILFCDVTGSTALGESLDPEALRTTMARYFEVARAAIERHGGTVEKFIGDAVMAVFGVPTIREDDALRAVRAAQELRAGVEIDVRIGLNTGEVVTGAGDSLVTGDAVNVAARLEQAASPGEVLLGAQTYGLVRDAVEVELLPPLEAKGKAAPLTAYRLVAVTGETAVARRLDAPLVGRERERRLLTDAWERTCSERACSLFTVLGPAGVGKSRLALEFLDGLDATIVRGRCLSYGDGNTNWPVVDVVRQLLGESEPPNATLAALLGQGQAPADEIAFAVRKLFEAAAAERPLVVFFDDLQWAEPTFLELIEHVADWSREAPILLLCLARPELLERQAGWGGGKLNATTVLLEPLTAAETDELIDHLLAGDSLDDELRRRIRSAAGGNPLFVEQMLAMVESAAGDVTVPATIQALISARLDQLPTAERAALERGSVEGQVFHRGTVAALAPEDPDVTSNLMRLVRKELVRPSAATLPGDDAFRFRHLLIRDAAYDALPKATRAELHERFASWVAQRAPDLVELDEILGYHLEQAAQYRAELGAPDPTLAAAAAVRLFAAGRRAVDRDDARAGVRLLQRALALFPDGGEEQLAVKRYLGEALYYVGDLEGADAALADASASADEDIAAGAFFFRSYARGHRGAHLLEVLAADVQARLAALEADGTVGDRTLSHGYVTLSDFMHWLGRCQACVDCANRGLELARAAGDINLEAHAVGSVGAGMYYGTTPFEECERLGREVLAEVDRFGPLAMRAQSGLANIAALQGRFEESRELFDTYLAWMADRGRLFEIASTAMSRGAAELAALEYERAESVLREGWDELGRLGEGGFRSTTGTYLGEALVELGRVDEALVIIDEAQSMTSPDDWVTHAYCSYVRGLAASAAGEHERAAVLAAEAAELDDQREYVVTRAIFRLGLGRVLIAAGRVEEARQALEDAVGLARPKGATVIENQALELLRLSAAPPAEAPRRTSPA